MNKVIEIDDYRPHITADITCKECSHNWVAVFPEKTNRLECPSCHVYVNEYGTKVFINVCKSCKRPFSVCPPPNTDDESAWQGCLSPDCDTYDPDRDADKYFTDE